MDLTLRGQGKIFPALSGKKCHLTKNTGHHAYLPLDERLLQSQSQYVEIYTDTPSWKCAIVAPFYPSMKII